MLPTARGDAHCSRLTFGQFLEVVLELGVEHLFRGRDVEWIKAAGADEDLRDRSSPDIMKAEEPDPGIRVDRPAGEVPAMFELAEDNAVKVKIEVQTVCLQLAISDSGDGRIDETVDRHRDSGRYSQQKRQLIFRVGTRYGEDDLIWVGFAGAFPHRFQVSMGEIGGSEVEGEGSAKWSGAQIVPKPAVEPARFETGATLRVEADEDFVTFDQRETGARPRQLSPRGQQLEPGVDQFKCRACHLDQPTVPGRWRSDTAAPD